jgi:hypothetical protein
MAVPKFCTWDLYLPKTERDAKSTSHRVAQARKIIDALNGVWWSKDITKIWEKIYNSMVNIIRTYGAETGVYMRMKGEESTQLRWML